MGDPKPIWDKIAGIAVIVGMISGVISIIIYFSHSSHWGGDKDPGPAIVNKYTSTTIDQSSTHLTIPPLNKTAIKPPPIHLEPPVVPGHTGKRAFLGVQTMGTGQKWDNNLSEELALLFTQKGYDAIETNQGSKEFSCDNLVSYNLTLSAPEEKKGAFNTVIKDYTVELTLEFCDGQRTVPCSYRIYHEIVSTDKAADRDGILIQGVTGLVSQLKNETFFPFCITKRHA